MVKQLIHTYTVSSFFLVIHFLLFLPSSQSSSFVCSNTTITSPSTRINPRDPISSDTLISFASSSSPTISASSSSSGSWNYDVFLSFRGGDTRKTYVNHLYNELLTRLIHTYKDDKTLSSGDSIRPSLMNAIEESRLAIVILSKDYAGSLWCLDELTYIMKCREERGQIVIPIFYDVDPSEVRNQKGEFGEAFAKIENTNINKAKTWRKALVDASNLHGWVPKNVANGLESDGIKLIVDAISDELFSLNLDVDTNLVGVKSRSQSLKSQLKIGSPGVRMVGIWGIGGGGKSTLAFSVYREISHQFKGHYFVDNIQEESRNKHGLKHLQEKILSTFLKKQVKVVSIEDGKQKIKQRLCRTNVLIVLDNVDRVDQLEALPGSHDWFGDGSRIIITTRDEHLLRTHKVDKVSPVSLLSPDEAIQLFYRYAHLENNPIEDYEKLSLRVVSYAAGLPLALKVIGKFLYDKDKDEWKSSLERLQQNPKMEIVENLKVSYDRLEPLEKALFLVISCFFKGEDVNDTMEILDACGLHSRIGIKVLRQKALITISGGRFDMHNLVQDMGRYIVKKEHPNILEECSTGWQTKVIDVMCSRDVTKTNDKINVITDDGGSLDCRELVSNINKLIRLL